MVLIHGLRRILTTFFRYGFVNFTSNPHFQDQGLTQLIWPLSFYMSGMGDPTRSCAPASIALLVTGVLRPMYDETIVLEDN
jgi:hypothetical protein